MKKTKFEKKAKSQIDKLFNKIENLEARKYEVSEDTLMKFEEIVRNLKYKRGRLQEKYQELTYVAEDRWKQTKHDFLNAKSSVKASVKECVALM